MSSAELTTKSQSSTAVIPEFLTEKVEGTKRKRRLCLELSFWPATSFIRKGYKKPIQDADMWRIDPALKGEDNWAKFEPHWKEELKKPEPSLVKALARSFGNLWGYAIAFQIFYALQGFVPAILLPYLVDYIKFQQVPIYYGFVMVAAIFLAQLFNSFLYYHAIFLAEIFGLKVRNVLIQLIYRKSLLMVPTTESSSGQVVNLMSTDAQTLAEAVSLFNMGVVAPIQIILAIALIWLQIGPYALISIGVVIVVLPFNLALGKRFSESRTLAQRDTDERVKLTNELLQAIRIVKYYAWEAPFARNLMESRKKELVSLKRMHVVRSLMIYSLILVPTIGIGLTFIAYSINNNFDVSTIFTTLALLNQMKSPLIMLPVSLAQFLLMKVSLDRILKFAKLPELPKTVKQIFIRERNQKSTSLKVFDPLMEIANGEFAWDPAAEDSTLKDINFQVRKGQLVMVVGPVGSGKSSLGLALLGEINKRKGSITLQGDVAYAGQQAWIINGTVRDNILFGLPYDEELYKKVIKASALEPDLAIMPAGDKTEIGSRGINLSGGQRQRISIARAVYSQRDCYIFDDPLSAVDAHVGRHIFENVMMGLLKGRNVLLITNQLQYLPHASNIYVLNDGVIVESGKYLDLLNNGKQFASLMEKFGIIDDESDLNKKKSKEEEERTVGVDDNAGKLTVDEDKETGFVSKKIWGDYIKAGGTAKFIMILVAQMLQAANTVIWNWWLSAWSVDLFGQTNNFYLGIFVMFLGLEALLPLVYYLLGVSHSIAASGTVHDEMLQTIIRSPTSFFDTTPLGRILGRFSKDMYVIDILLPAQLLQYMTSGFSVLSIFALLCVGSYFSLVAIVPAFVLYFFMQVFYRKTSIEVQRIESVSRSPIFSHFTETLGGVSTIRAYNLTDAFKKASMQKVNRNTRDFFQQRYIAAWFGMRLDWIGTLIVLATYLAIVITRTTNSVALQLAVLALSNTASLTLILNSFNINSTETEMRMNSVERVVNYIQDLEQEAPDHIPESSPPQDWPQHGQVELKELTVAYANSPEPVLKGVSAVVKSREKIGIVGRTGAGKSTMLTSLFRMVEPTSGTIVIDGVDITKIGLFDLRSKLSIIPQEPTLFIGTVRYNLDPFNEYSDKEVWDALDLVKLKDAIEKLPEGLWAPVSEGGANFSVGQRQLLCMARALLKKANVLLLDEATASVDIETDSLIQKTVRKYFADCTVLTIAHRLNTIMDSTRIMVLDKGQLVEFDTPRNLIRKQDGYFRSMVEATGPASAEHLKQLAIGEISVLESIKARMKEKQKSTRQIRAQMHAIARSETSASQSTAPASNTNKEKLI